MKKNLLLILAIVLCSYQSFSQCAVQQSVTLDPAPIDNQYAAGTIVTICYAVDSFDELGTNWFHGVVLNFGPGWDTSTISVISLPPGCDVNGIWGFYPSDISTGSGQTFGEGFYFDNSQGSPNQLLDGIPGNNYGDWGDDCGNESWTFCFSIRVDSNCTGGSDLSATATATGDGTTGSWSNSDCSGTAFDLVSDVTCAPLCSLSISASSGNELCFGDSTAQASVEIVGGTAPYHYAWSNGDTTQTSSNLGAGTYSVSVTDSTDCTATTEVTITEPSELIVDAGPDTIICIGLIYALGGNPTASGGTAPYHYSWTEIASADSANPEIFVQQGTMYHVTVSDTNGCKTSDSVFVDAVICEGISTLYNENAIGIYPNPNDGFFTITVSDRMVNEHTELLVYDVLGKEIIRKYLTAQKENLDLTSLPQGMYELVVRSHEFSVMKKMMKNE